MKKRTDLENEDVEPGDLADWYYEQWRDEQALSDKWENDEIELEA